MAEDWRSDLEIWLAPFLAALHRKTRARADVSGLYCRADWVWRPQERRHVPGMQATTSCTISYRVASGVPRRWRQCSWQKRTHKSAGTMPG